MTALPHEHKRVRTFGGINVSADTIHVTIEYDSNDQFTLYGFGLYLENGVLLAAYGQSTPIMEKSPAALLLLSADVQFTIIDAATLAFPDASFSNPPATTERQGVVELATQAEVDTGDDDSRVLTPKTAARRYAALTGAIFDGPVSTPTLALAGTIGKVRLALNNIAPGYCNWECLDAEGSWQATPIRVRMDGKRIDMIAPLNVLKRIQVKAMAHRVMRTTSRYVHATEYSHWFNTRTGDAGFAGQLDVAGPITASTPAPGNVSNRVATTAFVASALADALIGQIVFEARTHARAGYLKLNGALLKRIDYLKLWEYVLASGALVSEQAWQSGFSGCFSTGDGATTFRLPETRGQFPRCWDDGRGLDTARGIGTHQDSQNRQHTHRARAAPAGDHRHTGVTDEQGEHKHGGTTHHVGDHQHVSPWGEFSGWYNPPWGKWGNNDQPGQRGEMDRDNVWGMTSWSGAHSHGLDITLSGPHRHTVDLDSSGTHTHKLAIKDEGGGEARPTNVAMLAMIRAY
ncbi:hypothetical protein DFQ30_001756 [Apophysomyces sp. BC1015]|nr:hypothetical protein DFQ30_001756 [Apophysomyces sp. BC1015]